MILLVTASDWNIGVIFIVFTVGVEPKKVSVRVTVIPASINCHNVTVAL
jgi:hypothetical protein